MPRLPDFQQLGERPAPQPAGGIASYEPSMRHTGAGMVAAGQDMEQAGAIVAETNQRQDAMNAEAALNRLQATRLELEAGQGGFRNVKGGGAVGQPFLDTYQQKFTDASKDIEASLQNDNQKRLFQQRVPMAGLQYRSALLSHQAQETDHFNEQTENDTIDLARRQIFTSSEDPNAIGAGVAQINWAIDQKAKRLGWAPEVVAQAKLKYLQNVADDAAAMLVVRDPMGSLAALNRRMGVGQEAGPTGVMAFDSASPEKLVELHRRADAHVRVADNQMKAEAEKRLKVAEESTKELQTFALSGQMVSPAYEQELLLKVTGTPFEAAARQIIGATYAGATHGSLPLPQQDTRLRAVDAQLAGSSSPDERKLVEQARTITETQRAAYKENPWAAASRFGHQPPVADTPVPVDKVPQLIASVQSLMPGVEIFAGQPVSPLQPSQAKAFAEQLKTMPPDARAEMLAQAGSQLSAPRAAALAEQLDKHDRPLALALMMGADRTSAGRAASALVLRGAQALQDKTVKKDDSALAGWKAEIAGLVRGSLGDDRAEGEIIDAAYYVRASQEQEGATPQGFKPGSGAADAVAMVAGLPMERAGVKTLLPRGMKERDFDERLKAYTAQKLQELAPAGVLFVRGAPVPAAQIAAHLSDYGMRLDARSKRYTPVVRNAFVTLDPGGTQPLQLEIR